MQHDKKVVNDFLGELYREMGNALSDPAYFSAENKSKAEAVFQGLSTTEVEELEKFRTEVFTPQTLKETHRLGVDALSAFPEKYRKLQEKTQELAANYPDDLAAKLIQFDEVLIKHGLTIEFAKKKYNLADNDPKIQLIVFLVLTAMIKRMQYVVKWFHAKNSPKNEEYAEWKKCRQWLGVTLSIFPPKSNFRSYFDTLAVTIKQITTGRAYKKKRSSLKQNTSQDTETLKSYLDY